LQIKNVVTYIEVDKRKHPAKAIIDKAKNSFMKIRRRLTEESCTSTNGKSA